MILSQVVEESTSMEERETDALEERVERGGADTSAGGHVPEASCVLAVFFCGTDGSMEKRQTLLEWFCYFCSVPVDITDPSFPLDLLPINAAVRTEQFKMGFNGCGTDYGCRGVCFGHGLELQVERVVERVEQLSKRYSSSSTPAPVRIRLCCVGLSRGAIAIALLCRRLQTVLNQHTQNLDLTRPPPNPQPSLIIETHALLFDAVPGNFIWTGKLDAPFGFSLATQASDLSACRHLVRAVALYPHRPLIAIAAHAPLLFRYPETTQVVEDVILGAHQAALGVWTSLDCKLSFAYILEFLLSSGIVLSPHVLELQERLEIFSREQLLAELQEELSRRGTGSWRHAHQKSFFWTASIRRHRSARYLNRFHQRLSDRLAADSPSLPDSKTSLAETDQHEFLLEIYRSDGFSWCHLVLLVMVPLLFIFVLIAM